MSFEYKNPNSSVILSGPNSVSIDSNTGTNFSIYQVGGFCEVFSLDDLKFNIPSGSTGTILFSENIIPIDFSYNAPNGAPNVINLYSDGISSGRRKLGMVAYVYENNKTYQYNIPNYQTLFDNAVVAGSLVDIGTGYQCNDSTVDGLAFVNAWTGSTIEGISGVTRENARWVEYNPEIYLTGGTYNSGNTILYLYDNVGNTIEVTGFTVNVSGTTGSSGTSGAQGSSGQTGSSGSSGSSGNSGSSGVSGSSGSSGSRGTSGVSGSSGNSGSSGTSGVSGSSGNSGSSGTSATSGSSGTSATSGSSGSSGVSGSSGTSGLSGSSGNSGSSGSSGTSGVSGSSGNSGSSGVSGSSGNSGSSGSSGTSGVSGSSGNSGSSGSSGTSGAQGISAGQVYYLNESQNSDISGYKDLSTTPLATAEQSLVRSVPGNSTGTLVSDYITPELGFSVIPGGTQKFHLHFLKTNHNDLMDTYVEIQLANFSGQTIGPIITSNVSLIGWLDGSTPVEVNVDVTLPTTTIDPTNRMIVRIYLNNQQGSSKNVTFYTEGNSNYSFVLTSVGAIAGSSGTSGSSGSSGTSATSGSSGSSGVSGSSGTSGSSGSRGTSGSSGVSGSSGTSGLSGSSGTSGSSGNSGSSGVSGSSGTSGSNAGITSYTNPADNRVITSVSSTAINAESNLTFDGSILNVNTTSAFKLPVGTTAERPGSPTTGYLRYNTTIFVLEIYLDSSWKQISFSEITKNVEYLVVAGGGGGGYNGGGGGGGGGLLTGVFMPTLGTSYTVTVGAGGPGSPGGTSRGSNGNNSVFASQTAIGGGGGGSRDGTQGNGGTGGSGGGGGGNNGSVGGEGTASQGNNGGNSAGSDTNQVGGGGGGAGAAGTTGTSGGVSGNGGVGLANSITGISVLYAGGGGGNRTVNGSAGSNGNGSIGQGGLAGGPAAGGSSGAIGTVILKYQDFLTITVGAGLTSTTTGPSGGYKITTLTSGTGLISFNSN